MRLATKKPRYMVTVDFDTFDQVENFRYSRRFPTRSKATTTLIELGLAYLKNHSEEAEEIIAQMNQKKGDSLED